MYDQALQRSHFSKESSVVIRGLQASRAMQTGEGGGHQDMQRQIGSKCTAWKRELLALQRDRINSRAVQSIPTPQKI